MDNAMRFRRKRRSFGRKRVRRTRMVRRKRRVGGMRIGFRM